MNQDELNEYLQLIEKQGIKLSLKNLKVILSLEFFRNSKTKYIHIAGTNGKGSTATFIASILQESGYKTGLYTSPHLNDVRERIKVNSEIISSSDFLFCTEKVKNLCTSLLQDKKIDSHPTYFEFIFLVSLCFFIHTGTEIAVLETGMGGRLDATNVITPLISVITSISKDHTAYLGNTIKEIASEKAGIIKEKIPVICCSDKYSVSSSVIKKRAAQMNAPFYHVLCTPNHLSVKNGITIFKTAHHKYRYRIKTAGIHQSINSATAVMTAELLSSDLNDISVKSIINGIEKCTVPGRIETFQINNKLIILDVAHNSQGIRALRDYICAERGINRITLIFGVLKDKDYSAMARLLDPITEYLILTQPTGERSLKSEILKKHFTTTCTYTINKFEDALQKALTYNKPVVITGSFYLAGVMRELVLTEEQKHDKN